MTFKSLHKLANRLIPRETIQYRTSKASTTNEYGVRSSNYSDNWISIRAHVMPGIISSFGGKNINARDYKDFGLDFSKNYYTVYTDDVNVQTLVHKDSPDQFMFHNGKIFNIIQTEDWLEYNGWKRCYCEEVIP